MLGRRANPLQEFVRATRSRISGLRSKMLPGTVFHYTTAAGFIGILDATKRNRRHQMRATNFSFMNDPSEVTHGQGVVEGLLEIRLRGGSRQEVLFFEYTSLNFNLEMIAEVYVCCFTQLDDDLSQWRAYGSAATERYCIEFEAGSLQSLALAAHQEASFGPVLYESPTQNQEVGEILDKAASYVRNHRNIPHGVLWQMAQRTASRLARLVPRLKNPAYYREEEWRLVLWSAKTPTFDVVRGVVRPFVNVTLPAPLPIVSLRVMAPTRREVAMKAAQMVLECAGLNVTVRHSAIPFAE